MKTQRYVLISAIVFGVVALVHLVRLIQGWPLQLGPYAIPPETSWLGFAAAGALCVWGLVSLRR